MKTVSLSGSIRENVGKKDANLLRREGKVPSVLYGGKEQVHFHISENDAKKIVFTPNVYVIELEINGNKINDTFVEWNTEKNKCFAGFTVSGKNVGVNESITVKGEALSFLSTGIDTRVYYIKNF